MPGKLILTADDFGASEFIDKGISRAIAEGHVNTVTAFVTHNRSTESITKLAAWRRERAAAGQELFEIGLHFSLTSGSSQLGQKSKLTAKGDNPRLLFHDVDNYPYHIDLVTDMKAELLAQLTRLDTLLGDIPIDHVSSHFNIPYMFPAFYDAFIETIASYRGIPGKYIYDARKIPIRSPVTWFRKPGLPNCAIHPDNGKPVLFPGVGVEGLKNGFMKRIGETKYPRMLEKKIQALEKNIRSPHCLVDVIYDLASEKGINCLLNALEKQQPDFTAEMMFHLGYLEGGENMTPKQFYKHFRPQEEELHGIDIDYFWKRMNEELYTISEEMNLRQELNNRGIGVTTFGKL